jgi:hypothetical protein
MSRYFGVGQFISLILLAILMLPDLPLFAQDAGSVNQNPPAKWVDRDAPSAVDRRAGDVVARAGAPMDPRIDAFLQKWWRRTKSP